MRAWNWLKFIFGVWVAGCTLVSAPDLEVSEGERDFSNRPSRFGQFLKVFPSSILHWSGEAGNPLSTMCQPGYVFPYKVATISDCVQTGGVYVSATVTLGPTFPETVSGLYQFGCEGGLRQGFQSFGTTFNIEVSGTTTTVRFDFEGTLYALKDDWTYWDVGLVQVVVGQTAFMTVDNVSGTFTHVCTGQSQFSLNSNSMSCQQMDELISSVSCSPIF